MKLKEQIKARRLRKMGKSYSEILKKVKVSKGTLSIWLRDIKLAPEQKERLYKTLIQKGAYKGAKIKQENRIRKTEQIINEAKKEARKLSKNPLFLAGLMLYWAEGDKAKNEIVKFSNSDPNMIDLMMKWFRTMCDVSEKKFRIALHIHELHHRKNIEKYWSKITNIPLTQFHKTFIKPTSLKHRKNRLYNGTCAIRINDVNLFRKIKGWKIGFLEKLNIKPRRENMPS